MQHLTKKGDVRHKKSQPVKHSAGVHNRRQAVLKEVPTVVTGLLIDICWPTEKWRCGLNLIQADAHRRIADKGRDTVELFT
jgi:hypothetical protein